MLLTCSEVFWLAMTLCGGAAVIWYVISQTLEARRLEKMTPAEHERYHQAKKDKELDLMFGPVNPALICPHCQERGKVRTKRIEHKAGISGSKATAAVFTAGVSMLATGLSRKEQLTQARCGNCVSVWQF